MHTPFSSGQIAAKSGMWSRSSPAKRVSSRRRSAGRMVPHTAKAWRAAATAWSTSVGPASGMCAWMRPVAGLRCS